MKYVLLIFLLLVSIIFAQDNDACMQCHEDSELTGFNDLDKEISMFLDVKTYAKSIHGELSCIDCHQDLDGFEEYPHDEKLEPVNCGICHDDAAEEYEQTMHGLKLLNLEDEAPKCSGCHGTHNILPSDDEASLTYFKNLPNTCCNCHQEKSKTFSEAINQPCESSEYLLGVHGNLVMEGNDSAPTCNNCHPAHGIRKGIDPQSTTHKLNIGETCGQCHVEELAQFSESIHAKALRHGILASATCTDCHGEHEIKAAKSTYIYASNDACIECHNDPKLIKKYNLSESVVSTFEDSYHGLSVHLGSEDAATCGSCHENHNIHSKDDPYSSVHDDHLVETCGKCHENSTENFAHSYTHEAMLIESNPANYWVTVIYVFLIIGVIGAMLIHNIIIILKYIRYKKSDARRYYVTRFMPSEVIQHLILMITFTLLAITGFALRFPDAWWVKGFEAIGVNESFRGILHRLMGVLLVAVSIYHIYFIAFKKRGRHLLKEIMVKFSDIPEIIQTLKYYSGISKVKPQYEEFDYTEKAEYWAVVWGTVVMGVTGVVLWFPTVFTTFAPGWIIRVSELIHYYEAILATLAIVVFHLFFVLAHPEQYPMNLAWLTGKMPILTAIRKHPKWIEKLLKEDEFELLPEVIHQNCETLEDVEKLVKFGDLTAEISKGHVY